MKQERSDFQLRSRIFNARSTFQLKNGGRTEKEASEND